MIIKCINFQLVLVETDNDVLFLIFNLTPIYARSLNAITYNRINIKTAHLQTNFHLQTLTSQP